MDNTKALINIIGALTIILNDIIVILSILVTSLVKRVIKLDELNLSILLNDNCWTLSNSALRRFEPNPRLALAAKYDAAIPAINDIDANTNILIPLSMIADTSLFFIPISTISAITNGINNSRTASIPTKRTENKAAMR